MTRKKEHGMSNHPLYRLWGHVKERCDNPKSKSYYRYGGRGIVVCNEWINNPKLFIEWSLENGYKKGLEIDRIDNDKGYSPENCRFVTREINNLNRGLNRNNTSGFVGVSWHKVKKRWLAHIMYLRKKYNLGYFKTKKEALETRNKYIIDNNLKHKLQKWS